MNRPSRVIAPAILLLIIVGFFWKLLTKQFTWMDSPDIVYQVLPWYQFQAVSWHHGVFPLWDPHMWAGQPLIGQLQPQTTTKQAISKRACRWIDCALLGLSIVALPIQCFD